MNMSVQFEEIKAPIKSITFNLTEKEARHLYFISGNLIGGGEVRETFNQIFRELNNFFKTTDEEYADLKKKCKSYHLAL